MTREPTARNSDLRGAWCAMASMVDKAIDAVDRCPRAAGRVGLAQQVVAEDRAINEHRWRTEEQALLLIATQAPMAGDLRMIAAVIHIVTDLERMADHAAGIAKIVIETADQPLLKPLVDIPRMSEIARTMLHDAITAFIEGDEAAARAIVVRDDEVDALYEQIYRELLTFMMADPTTINQATHLLWARTTWSASPTGSPISASGSSSRLPANSRSWQSPPRIERHGVGTVGTVRADATWTSPAMISRSTASRTGTPGASAMPRILSSGTPSPGIQQQP